MKSQTEKQFSPMNAALSRMAFPCGLADLGRDEQGVRQAKWHFGFYPKSLMLFLCGLVALGTPIPARAQAGGDAGLKNAVILVIRHAEKPDKGDGLSKAGKQRAKAYVKYFKNFTVDSQPLKVDYLFATADSKASRRPRLTLEPFSKAVGLAINAQFQDTQVQQLVNAIQAKPPGKTTLICWHHEQIPQLATALGANSNDLFRNGKWPDNVFGWVIQLRYDSDGHLLEAKRINENLMPDDSNK
jgi:hypothetical protein